MTAITAGLAAASMGREKRECTTYGVAKAGNESHGVPFGPAAQSPCLQTASAPDVPTFRWLSFRGTPLVAGGRDAFPFSEELQPHPACHQIASAKDGELRR